jgi:hypothetical protein
MYGLKKRVTKEGPVCINDAGSVNEKLALNGKYLSVSHVLPQRRAVEN